MEIKEILNKKTINYLKQIESIICNEVNEKSALYYRQEIINKINFENNKNERKSLICETNNCFKCLSKIKKWRIRPKTKFNGKSNKLNANKVIGSCIICNNINRFEGIYKQINTKTNNSLKTTENTNKLNLNKTPDNWPKFLLNTPKSSYNSMKTPNNNSLKQKLILKNLLNSSKKKKMDRKTGLFDFLQICTQNQ